MNIFQFIITCGNERSGLEHITNVDGDSSLLHVTSQHF